MAFCNKPVDHVVAALLTAAVMDVIGGIANAELREDQVPIVAVLPGIVARVTDPWPAAYGSANSSERGPATRLPPLEVAAGQPEDTGMRRVACQIRARSSSQSRSLGV